MNEPAGKLFFRNRELILLSLALFLVGAGTGLALISTVTTQPFDGGEQYAGGPHRFDSAWYGDKLAWEALLKNNLFVVSTTLLPFSFGAATSFNLISNGYYLGSLAGDAALSHGLWKVSIAILPHGVFEYAAILIAGAAGFKIPYEVTRYLVGTKSYVLDERELVDYAYLSTISVSLTLVAAWIETSITLKMVTALT